MNYKDLFHIAILLISSPARAWEEISLEDRRKVFTAFVYPMIGLCGLSVFIGSLMKMGWDGPQSFQYAMTQCCAVAVSLFGGYFLAAYLINGLRVRMFMLDSDIPLAQQFAGYALVVVFMLRIVIGILPDFGIMALLLQFYIVYVVWEGSKKVMQIAEKDRLRFTILSSILLRMNGFSRSMSAARRWVSPSCSWWAPTAARTSSTPSRSTPSGWPRRFPN